LRIDDVLRVIYDILFVSASNDEICLLFYRLMKN